jgi:hypothetical protein
MPSYRIEFTSVVEGLAELEDAFGGALGAELEGLDAGPVVSVVRPTSQAVVTFSLDATSALAACSMGSEALNRALAVVGLDPVEWECDAGGSAMEAP